MTWSQLGGKKQCRVVSLKPNARAFFLSMQVGCWKQRRILVEIHLFCYLENVIILNMKVSDKHVKY